MNHSLMYSGAVQSSQLVRPIAPTDSVGCAGLFVLSLSPYSRQNATAGCRECLIHKSALDTVVSDIDCLLHGRTQASDDKTRREAVDEAQLKNSVAAGESILQEQGIVEQPSPLLMNGFDRFSQLPFDPFHAEYLGVCLLVMTWFALSLTAAALSELNARLPRLDVPKKCGRLVPWVLSTGSKKAPCKLKLKAQQLASAVQVPSPFKISGPSSPSHPISPTTTTHSHHHHHYHCLDSPSCLGAAPPTAWLVG
jgi:hypothetical protein